jgi:hypothetical protein
LVFVGRGVFRELCWRWWYISFRFLGVIDFFCASLLQKGWCWRKKCFKKFWVFIGLCWLFYV